MSFELIPKKLLFKRLSIFFVIMLSFSALILVYANNEEMIKHYKPYYLKSYLYVAQHRLASLVLKKNNQTGTANAKSVPVLVYHGMIPKPDGVSTSLEEFKNEMFALKAAGYQTVHINDFYGYIQGKKELPDKSFLLTFDDGRKDSYYPVDPILQDLNYSAVMFVITDTLNTPTNNFHITQKELEVMQKSGRWDLEAHTYNGHGLIDVDSKGTKGHFYSNKMWLKDKNRLETDQEFDQRIRADLLQAKTDMKSYFGINAFAFAFPFNDYAKDSLNFPGAQAIFNAEVNKVYSLLFYQSEPSRGFSSNLFASNSQLIRRINVETYWSSSDLLNVIHQGREKDLPIRYNTFNTEQGWIRTSGNLYYAFNKLRLESDVVSNQGIVLLNGTSSFKDYQTTLDFTWDKGTDFSIILNQREIPNYYTATLTAGQLTIGKVVNNQSVDIYKKDINIANIHSEHALVYKVVANKLTLTLDGQNILTDFTVPDSETNGGMGFEIWDKVSSNASVTINNLQVENESNKP